MYAVLRARRRARRPLYAAALIAFAAIALIIPSTGSALLIVKTFSGDVTVGRAEADKGKDKGKKKD